LHHEAVAEIRRGQGIEGVIKEDGKVIMRWNISAKKTTPTLEVIRALQMASFGGYILIEIKMEDDLWESVPDLDRSLEIYGVPITRLSEA